MQRTDQMELLLEQLAILPLTWENVYRSPQYTAQLDKEVVDLLLILRSNGIFISLKCQQNPDSRTKDKLYRWVQKSALYAVRQISGGIRTSKTREFWCTHHRRGRVTFEPNQISPVRAVILIESHQTIQLNQELPLEIDSIPVSYFTLDDFLNLLNELRTFNDLLKYMETRSSICQELQRTLGIEQDIFEQYVLQRGSLRGVSDLKNLQKNNLEQKSEILQLITKRNHDNQLAAPIERLSDNLSTRLENHEEGLDEVHRNRFDPNSQRRNYLLIQNELCDLVLDERRKMGVLLSHVAKNAIDPENQQRIGYQAGFLDSKPDFLYILSSSKSLTRNDILHKSSALIYGGLSHYGMSNGLLIHYNHDLDNFDTILVKDFEDNEVSQKHGTAYFAELRISDIPIEKV